MGKSLHAVMVPFPVQGGINPLMQLAHLLSERGFFITIINIELCHRHMLDVDVQDPQQPLCAALSISQFKAELLFSRGHIPVKLGEAKRPENLITCLPGNLPPLLPTDLVSFYRAERSTDALVQRFLYESRMQNKGDYVMVNTMEKLEGKEAVAALSINGCPAVTVGSLFLPNFLAHRDVVNSTSMFAEDESCLEWLDAQQQGSVIYGSFGSTAVKSKQQLEEITLGLENNRSPFLWVLRKDNAR